MFVFTTARWSESLRICVGGNRRAWWVPKIKGRPPAGLYSEGATLASGCLPPVRDWSASFTLLPTPRRLLAVLLVVAGFCAPRHVVALRNQPGPVV